MAISYKCLDELPVCQSQVEKFVISTVMIASGCDIVDAISDSRRKKS